MKQINFDIPSDNNSLRAQVFRELEQAILGGTLAPGDSLNELKVSAELGVSRTPVREAIRQLELEGLVKSVPNKGSVVVGVSEKDIEDIYTIRMRIEGLASRWAAANITAKELEQLKNILELQEFYAQRGDALQVWQLDSRFHSIIFDASRSRPLQHTLANFHNYIQKAREISIRSPGRVKPMVVEHRQIYEAIAGGDGEAAEKLTGEHIRIAKENLLANIKMI